MGTIVLSFDDGRIDNYLNVYPLLSKLNMPATFNITTGYIDGTICPENLFCPNEAMTKEEVKEIAKSSLFEIASHGDNHLNVFEDILCSINKLKDWGVVSDYGIGFASPNHGLEKEKNVEIEELRNALNLNYIRIGGQLKKDLGARVYRTVARLTHSNYLIAKAYRNSIMDNIKTNQIYTCLPYSKRISVKKIKKIIDTEVATSHNKVLILLFHSVLKIGEDYYNNIENIDYDEFRWLCFELVELQKKGYLSIKTTLEL